MLARHVGAPERIKVTEFEIMGLPAPLVARLTEAGLTEPTAIQTRAIPPALDGRDVIGLAQTGTGKTLAFGLPLLAVMGTMGGRPAPRSAKALVLAPTRELVRQIAEALRPLVAGTPVRVEQVVGGASINVQMRRLERGTDLLVATPGRLQDLMNRGAVSLAATRFLVLDEADQMLDLGFIHALRRIAQALPSERQTMMFSATMPKAMDEIAAAFLDRPVKVQVSPPGTPVSRIAQSLHYVGKRDKGLKLAELLAGHMGEQAIVFGRTKHGSDKLAKFLTGRGFDVVAIHGNKSQGQRDRALKAFREGQVSVLVATDVAARGLDIPEVRHVYNFDLPNVAETYVHRIGRTARAGAEGAAVALCAPDEMEELRAIQKLLGRSIPVASGTPWEPEPDAKPVRGGGRGRGGSGGAGGPAGKAKPRPRRRSKPRARAA